MLVKIPLRVSFLGGGTEIPPYLYRSGGLTVSSTINRYVHVSDELDNYPDVDNYNDLIQATRRWFNTAFPDTPIPEDYKILVSCEMPPGTGLGASSAIVIGLIKLLRIKFLGDTYIPPQILAQEAVLVERSPEYANIPGGIQDQYACSYCGLNMYTFHPDDLVTVVPFTGFHYFKFATLEEHVLLVDTGKIRRQAELMKKQIQRIDAGDNTRYLDDIKTLVPIFVKALQDRNWYQAGKTLYNSWLLKKQLAPGIEIPEAEQIIDYAMSTELAYGGKLLGAGGGGYVVLLCQNRQKTFLGMTSKGYRCVTPEIATHHIIRKDGEESERAEDL